MSLAQFIHIGSANGSKRHYRIIHAIVKTGTGVDFDTLNPFGNVLANALFTFAESVIISLG